jgi:glutamate synthase domain-containing protein 3
LVAPEEHQLDIRFVLGKKFRNEKRYVHQRKALEIWSIEVFEFWKIGPKDQKLRQKKQKYWFIFGKSTFLTKNL